MYRVTVKDETTHTWLDEDFVVAVNMQDAINEVAELIFN